jgi:hypothetical protein
MTTTLIDSAALELVVQADLPTDEAKINHCGRGRLTPLCWSAMSYFIVISGIRAKSMGLQAGRLIPLSEAQPYVSGLSEKIMALDGGPSFFWDDDETGTSSELVWEAENSVLENLSLEASALGKLLADCEANHVTARIWWAGNDSDSYLKVPAVLSSVEALELVSAQAGMGPGIGFVLHSNYSSKPTADAAA